MKILRHGCTYKQTPVLLCDNCSCVAVFNLNEVGTDGKVLCPECKNEETILFYDKQEMKNLLEEIKEDK